MKKIEYCYVVDRPGGVADKIDFDGTVTRLETFSVEFSLEYKIGEKPSHLRLYNMLEIMGNDGWKVVYRLEDVSKDASKSVQWLFYRVVE